MMRKKWILPILLAIFTLPFFSGAVFAEETVVYEEGEHKVPFVVKHGTEDKVSAADGFLTKPAKFTIKNGSTYVQLELKNSDMIKSLTVPSGEVDLISENGESNTRIVGFNLAGDLSAPVVMEMHVVVPGLYEETHTARAYFDVTGVPLFKEEPVEEPTKPEVKPEEPTEPTKPEEKPAEPTKPTKPEEKPTEPTKPEEEPTKPEKPSAPKAIDLADGFYTINGSFLHLEEEKASSMARYLGSPMFLEVVNGKVELTVTVNEDETVTLLKVDGKNAVKSKVDGKKRYDTYELDSLATVLHGYAEYQAPMGNGKMHYGKAEFRITLAEESIANAKASAKPGYEKEAEVPAKPETPEKPSKPKEPVKNDGDKVENKKPAQTPDKAYKINFVSESSSVNRQFSNPAVLLYKNGVKYIQMTGTGGQYIESLTINGTEVTWGKKNADGTFTFEFKVEGSLSDVLDFGMVIDARGNEMIHLVDLAFDESTKKAANIKDYTLLTVIKESEEEVKVPAKPEKPSKGEELVDKEKPADKPKTPAKKDQLVPDKAYQIDFVIKHDKEEKPSAANSFFKGPAILLEKDGQKYLQITVTGKQYINSLKNKFGEMVVVKEVGDTVILQFKLDGSLTEAVVLDMIISVPGIYENQEHIARLFLDKSSMKEVDASDYRLVASSNENGPTVEGAPDKDGLSPVVPSNPQNTNNNDTNNTKKDPTIEKPKFGSNETSKSIIETVIAGKEKNPQTGDTTNILLYVLLLIGSAIPLAVMTKRRFAKVV